MTAEQVIDHLENLGILTLSDTGKAEIRKWIETYSLETVKGAIDEAFGGLSKNFPEPRFGNGFYPAWTKAYRGIPLIAEGQLEEVK